MLVEGRMIAVECADIRSAILKCFISVFIVFPGGGDKGAGDVAEKCLTNAGNHLKFSSAFRKCYRQFHHDMNEATQRKLISFSL